MNAMLRLLVSLILIVASMPTCSAAPSSSTAAQAQFAAKLTEARGSVYKRGFIDWNREQWGEPAPAKAGDALNEGMQVGTGDNSWAQISWTNIKTRAWANSVYAIAPNQRLVYLIGGEMLFQLDKNRKDKSEYHVWTNLLHARIRGTTVLVQSTGEVSRVTCLEGHIDVINRTDNSVIHLKPGAVYEIKSVPSVDGAADAAEVVGRPTASLSNLTPITAQNTARPVFETNKTTSTVYLVDKQALLSHPLLTNFESPLPSLPLINDALGALGLPNLIGQIVPQTLKHVLGDVFEIAQLPTRLNYRIGPDAGGLFSVNPNSLSLQPPDGILNLPETAMLLDPKAVPGLGNAGGLVTQISPLSPQSQLLPGVTALPGVSSITSATGTLSSLSAVTGTSANLGTVTSTATSTLGTVSTTANSTLNSVTGLVGGTVGRVVTPLTGGGGTGGGGGGGLLPDLGGGGGLGGALGGLLGH
ncbi:MAG: FecR domain-containing protein [Candidatus Obscuribacterales bacterium]